MNNTENQNPEEQFKTTQSKPRELLNKRAVVLTVVIFMLIVVGMFTFAYLKKTDDAATTPQQDEEQDTKPQEEGRFSDITRIEGKHFYIDGVHTVVGEIAMPTPCDLLNTDVAVAESFPEQITIDFSVVNNADMCAQVITPARFKVEAEASEDATFSARFEGRSVELNLVPAGEGETPEDFELFIKG